ncbi:MAG TPA: HAD family hydrolase [Candidatus Wallbacteria bacterium]|nr:HAD family hydrolase [Candidatus Wallbacteria bacterium]
MTIRGIIFDINGTLVDISTNEMHDGVYRVMSNLLSYQGIFLDPELLKETYFKIMRRQFESGGEKFPEFDASGIFREIITLYSTDFTRGLPPEKLEQLPLFLAETFRAASLFHLRPYPEVEGVIKALHSKYRLAAVSDGQAAYVVAELNAVGLLGYFDPVVVSGDFGYRKPDVRLFETALDTMHLGAREVLFVGNDMYRDVYGANASGIKTIFFKSENSCSENEVVKPDYIINNFNELLDIVECPRLTPARLR